MMRGLGCGCAGSCGRSVREKCIRENVRIGRESLINTKPAGKNIEAAKILLGIITQNETPPRR
jgi:hypothetical protein